MDQYFIVLNYWTNDNDRDSLKELILNKGGIMCDLTANVHVQDGLVNGAKCCVTYVERNPTNDAFPKCIWVEFIDNAVGRNLRRRWGTFQTIPEFRIHGHLYSPFKKHSL